MIYLHQSGGPSQLETFDYKPVLTQRNGEQLPDSARQGRLVPARKRQVFDALLSRLRQEGGVELVESRGAP